MKVLVCGYNRFTDRGVVHGNLNRVECEREPITIVMQFGQTTGPEDVARSWVFEENIGCELVKKPNRLKTRTLQHDWDKYGPGAHHKTYDYVLEKEPPDLVFVFGPERGEHRAFVRRARERGIEIIEIPFEERFDSNKRAREEMAAARQSAALQS